MNSAQLSVERFELQSLEASNESSLELDSSQVPSGALSHSASMSYCVIVRAAK